MNSENSNPTIHPRIPILKEKTKGEKYYNETGSLYTMVYLIVASFWCKIAQLLASCT